MGFVKHVKSKTKAQYDVLIGSEKLDKIFYLDNSVDTSAMTDAEKRQVDIDSRIMVNGKDYSGVKRVEVLSNTPNGHINVDGVDITVYTHPQAPASAGTGGTAPAAVKVGKDATGHVVLGDALTKSDVSLSNVDNTSDATKKTNFTGEIAENNSGFVTGGAVHTALAGKIASTEKGANNGVATLGEDGKIPSSQLPSYVDDVIECLNFTDTAPASCAVNDYYYNTSTKKLHKATAVDTWGPAINPEGGKIYVNLTNSKTYRWGGTDMAPISDTIALGETQGTAYEGSKGKANADAITALQSDKANKSEMSIADVSGDATKKNITLKTGLSQDVLVAHQSITGKADKAVPAAAGNVATLDANGNLSDSGKTLGKSVPADANFANTVTPVADTTNKKIHFSESNDADIYFIGGDMKVTVKDGHSVQFDANITPGTAVVSTSASQGLSAEQKSNARANIDAASTAVVTSSANGLATPDMLAALEWE